MQRSQGGIADPGASVSDRHHGDDGVDGTGSMDAVTADLVSQKMPAGVDGEDVDQRARQQHLPGGEPAPGIAGALPAVTQQEHHGQAGKDQSKTEYADVAEIPPRPGKTARRDHNQ